MMSRSLFMGAAVRAAALSVALLLAACGDDPHSAPEAPVADDTVPASALASATTYTQFVGGLSVDDRAPPRRLDGVTPPTSETAEPLPVR